MPTIPTKPSRARNRPSNATASTVITIPFVRRPATVPALWRRPHADTLDAFLAPVRGDVPAAGAGRRRRARNFVARARSRNFVAPSCYRSWLLSGFGVVGPRAPTGATGVEDGSARLDRC